MSELLERERELTELAALAKDARAGTGRLAVVEAAAGLGKTRLLRAARASGDRAGLRVFVARGTELERGFPFAVVRQLFEPAIAALDASAREALFDGAVGPARGAFGIPHSTPPTDAFAVLHGLYWLTAAFAEQQPLLLAIDDGHWSDAASLDYLTFLLPRLEELPVLVLLASRTDEADAEPSLARITTDASARRLTPRTLSRAGTTALLAGALKRPPDETFAAACHEVSGGNPFLLGELARTLAMEAVAPVAEHVPHVRSIAPERVTRTVQLRLTRLSAEARALANALVILGDGADAALVAEFAGLDAARSAHAADALRAAAILDRDAPLRFIHPLVRTALEAELPVGERAVAHARAGELLAAHGANAQQLAKHLVMTDARGSRATTETLLEAGRSALATGAGRSARSYLMRALHEPAPEDLRPAILDALVTAGIHAPDRSQFGSVWSALEPELDRDPTLRLNRGIKISMWMILNGHAREAIGFLQDAITQANADGEAEHAFRLEAQLSAIVASPVPETRERLTPYLDRLPTDSASGRLAAALASEWQAFDGTATEAVAAARLALAHESRIFVEQPELLAPGRPVLTLILADELDAARRATAHAQTYARRRGVLPELVAATWISGLVAWGYGDLANAEADFRQALQIAGVGQIRFAERPVRAALASVLIARGEHDAAAAELDASGIMTEAIRDVVWDAVALFPRGQLHLEHGRFEQAAADFLQLERLSIRWGVIGLPTPPARICAARAVAALGDRERARTLADAALTHARRWGAPTLVSRALRTSALGLEGTDRLTTLQEAVTVLEGSPARLVRAEALADLGAALRRARRATDARPHLHEALELARRCGAVGLAKQAFDELAASGERLRRYTPIGVESLTPSQRRVAELAASGMTNRQIAQTLFLTVKTIESHLAAAYDTLGIRSRRALPEALGRRA